MALDAAALENLEVLEASGGGTRGSLLGSLDHCATPGGRATLRSWLARPLVDPAAIVRRQDAVAELMGPLAEAGAATRKELAGLADARRAIVRLTTSGLGLGPARDAPHVVLYEDTARKRVRAVAGTLRALRQVQRAAAALRAGPRPPRSALLSALATPGEDFPEALDEALRGMLEATDWEVAESSGSVVPAPGVDAAYDRAVAEVAAVDRDLGEYLKDTKRELGVHQISYVSVSKDSHVLQVPETATVPGDWEPVPGKKGVKRYISPAVKRLVKRREEAHAQKETAQAGILTELLRRFAAHKDMWLAAVECVSQMDALLSLAIAAVAGGGGGPMCRPEILPYDNPDAQGAHRPVFCAEGLRHPISTVIEAAGSRFVPNDVTLGGDAARFAVLTGPNMGGKSTLMRQVCLAALLAQVGAWVPAERLRLTPADALFVRMGACDRILLGQSTFFVEMAETSGALARATCRSLVVLDELGRGTATTDGAAIAEAVLEHLVNAVGCRGMFATHYHAVAEEAARKLPVALVHMACRVDRPRDVGGPENIVFLYKLADGACPSSYGVNVARLAGLPERVVARASKLAEEIGNGRLPDGHDCDAQLARVLRLAEQGPNGVRQARALVTSEMCAQA